MLTDAANPPGANAPLRVILIEDSADDVALLLRALRVAGYAPEYAHVQTPDELARALGAGRWDIVLSDYALPAFTGLLAMRQVFECDPDIPFIIVSGNIGENVAVAAMKAGAHDYLLKDNLTRLGGAIQRELREAGMRRARRRNELELLDAKQRLQALSNRMLEMQEAERRHIARELHDEIGQSLTAIKLSVDALARHLHDDPARHLATEIAAAAGHVLDQVRQLSLDLRPPQLDDLGLRAALHWLVKRHACEGGPVIELEAPEDVPGCTPQAETACFRIVQETLTNALRHADASQVRIELSADAGHCCLEVSDNGCGFDVTAARARALKGSSLGLLSMQERAALAGGELSIASGAGDGTCVRARFPLPVVSGKD